MAKKKVKTVKLNQQNEVNVVMKRVLIGMPCGSGLIPWQTAQSLLALHKPPLTGFLVVERQRVDKARNYLAMQALQQGFDYLFFIDDDNPIPPDTLEKFLMADKDIISAPVLSRNPDTEGNYATCVFGYREKTIGGKKIKLYKNQSKFKGKGPLHKVAAVGMACTLIKRHVLEILNIKYKDQMFEFGKIKFKKTEIDGTEYDTRTTSEDIEFCERAVDAGFEIWIDKRIRPYHITGVTMNQWKDK